MLVPFYGKQVYRFWYPWIRNWKALRCWPLPEVIYLVLVSLSSRLSGVFETKRNFHPPTLVACLVCGFFSFNFLAWHVSPPGIFSPSLTFINLTFFLVPDGSSSDCPQGMFQCPEGTCIPTNRVCNYQKDCEKGEDELQSCRKYLLINYGIRGKK